MLEANFVSHLASLDVISLAIPLRAMLLSSKFVFIFVGNKESMTSQLKNSSLQITVIKKFILRRELLKVGEVQEVIKI